MLIGALAGSPAVQAQLSDQATVSLITVYPGEAIYSLWGHSALRIHDPLLGMDIAYNYGTFDFGNPLIFVTRFAYGKLDYHLSRQHYPALKAHAQQGYGRTMIEQRLVLDHKQKNALFLFLERNALPEHRTYRYDFLFDNCSTRIRDVLTEVLGVGLPAIATSELTYRELLLPYTRERSFLHFAINLGMGLPSDIVVADRSFFAAGANGGCRRHAYGIRYVGGPDGHRPCWYGYAEQHFSVGGWNRLVSLGMQPVDHLHTQEASDAHLRSDLVQRNRLDGLGRSISVAGVASQRDTSQRPHRMALAHPYGRGVVAQVHSVATCVPLGCRNVCCVLCGGNTADDTKRT